MEVRALATNSEDGQGQLHGLAGRKPELSASILSFMETNVLVEVSSSAQLSSLAHSLFLKRMKRN